MVALLAAAAWFAGCAEEKDSYPYRDAQAASKLGNYRGWYLYEVLGDTNGPYRATGGGVLNAGSSGKWVWYTVDGKRIKHDLSHLKCEVLWGGFENQDGNSMVLVFTREQLKSATQHGQPVR
jgi:hypothetical protein